MANIRYRLSIQSDKGSTLQQNFPHLGLSMKDWEKPLNEFFKFMYEEELLDTIRYLSPVYRVSNYCIEGERGLLSNMATPQSGNYNRVVNELDLGAILD